LCEIRRNDVSAQTDTTQILPYPLSSGLNQDKQNISALAEELSKKPAITMNGHNNYHVGQQIFYVYDSLFFKRLLPNNKANYNVTSDMSAHKLSSHKLSWNKARMACIQDGGHLAIVNSDSEEKILLQLMAEKSIDRTWLGVHDLYEEGDWVTVNNEALEDTGYVKWHGNEPNNWGGDQNCGALIKEGGMDDVECNTVYFFFCEIPA